MIIKKPPTIIDRSPAPGPYFTVVTFLPVARWPDVIGLFRISSRVQGQLKQTPGVVAYGLAFDLLKRHFWTYSIWRDRTAITSFTHAEPHATAVRKFVDWAGEGAAFVEWESDKAALDWDEAFERLKEPTFYYQKTR